MLLSCGGRVRGWARPLRVASVAYASALVCVSGAAAAAPSPPRVRAVSLPRDHGAHAGFETEWWYTAGTLTGARGRSYFWFATAWAAPEGLVARVNVVALRRDRIGLADPYLPARAPAQGPAASQE